MLIRSVNNLHITAPKTYLSNNEVVGTSIFRIRNTTGLGSSWGIQIGEVGEELSETLVLSGNPGSGTLGTTTGNSLFAHPADTPIYGIKFNQVVFERSITGTSGTAAVITNGTITYQADNSYTIFDDTSGSTSYAYKTYFQNSITGAVSLESDWITPAGFDFYSLAAIRSRIRSKVFNSDFVVDDDIRDWVNEWKDKMVNQLIKLNADYQLGTENVAFGTDGLGTFTTADFSQIRRVWISYDGTGKFASGRMDINDLQSNQVFSPVHPYHAWFGNNVMQIKPEQTGGTIEAVFYRFGTTMVNDTDTLPLPMRAYTDSFVNYGVAQVLFKDTKYQESQQKLAEANNSMADFISLMSPRDKSGPTYIDIRDNITGDDSLLP